MKVQVNLPTLRTAVKYLTIMYLMNDDIRHEDFNKMIEELEAILEENEDEIIP